MSRAPEGRASPRPWTYRAKVLGAYWVLDGDGMTIALVETEEAAALIVRAVNAHDELLACLRWAMSHANLTYSTRNNSNTAYCDAVDRARAAIRAAEGGDSQ